MSLVKKLVKDYLYQMICAVLLAVLLLFFHSYIQTDEGKIVFNHFLGTFPFIKFIVDTVREITGIQGGLEDITINSQIMDFTKLLVSTLFKAALFRIGSRIFLRLPFYARNQILGPRTVWINEAEEIMKSPWYKVKKCIVSLASVLLGTFLVNLIINPLSSWVNGLSSRFEGTIFSILAFVIVYLICSLIFALISGYSFGFSLIKTLIFNILPEILSVFGTNMLCVAVYLSWENTGFHTQTLTYCILLLVWCIVSEIFTEWLQKLLCRSSFGSFSIGGLIQNVFLLMASLDSVLLFYVMVCTNTNSSDNLLTQNIDKFPFVGQLKAGMTVWESITMPDGAVNLLGLLFLCLLMTALSMTMRPVQANILVNLFVWSLMQGIMFTIILIAYAGVSWLWGLGALWPTTIVAVAVIILFLLLMFAASLLLTGVCTAILSVIGLMALQMSGAWSGNAGMESVLIASMVLVATGFLIHGLRYLLF